MVEEQKMELSPQQAASLLQRERSKLEGLQRQLQQIQTVWEDTLRAKEALEHIQKASPNNAVLIPLGAGTYASGVLSNTKTVHVTLGGGIIKPNSIATALEKLVARKKEAEQQLETLQKEFRERASNVQNLGAALQQSAKAQSKGAPSPAIHP